MACITKDGHLVLAWMLGPNTTTGGIQWQAREDDLLFVLDARELQPNANGEQWVCQWRDRVGYPGWRGSGVIRVRLVRLYAPSVRTLDVDLKELLHRAKAVGESFAPRYAPSFA